MSKNCGRLDFKTKTSEQLEGNLTQGRSMDKLKLKGQSLGRILSSRVWSARLCSDRFVEHLSQIRVAQKSVAQIISIFMRLGFTMKQTPLSPFQYYFIHIQNKAYIHRKLA